MISGNRPESSPTPQCAICARNTPGSEKRISQDHRTVSQDRQLGRRKDTDTGTQLDTDTATHGYSDGARHGYGDAAIKLERFTVGLRAAEADGKTPHPPFGHLLPDGEKGMVNASAKPSNPGQVARRSPSPRRKGPG